MKKEKPKFRSHNVRMKTRIKTSPVSRQWNKSSSYINLSLRFRSSLTLSTRVTIPCGAILRRRKKEKVPRNIVRQGESATIKGQINLYSRIQGWKVSLAIERDIQMRREQRAQG